MDQQTYYRGQIYYVYPSEAVGSEQEGGRPAIIVSNDVGNEFSKVVEVVYLTTREKKPLPTHVRISSTNRQSIALCEQIETIDKQRIGKYINEISEGELKNLEKAMLVSLGIQTNLKGTKYLELWRKMAESYEAEEAPEENPAIKTSGEEVKEQEKGMEKAVAAPLNPELRDIETEPAYIKLAAQRDVYKELYMNLLKQTQAV